MKKNKFSFTVILILFAGSLFAQVHLPSFFSDNMVLQRNTEVRIWGWANKWSQVSIIPSWSNDTIKVKATGHARWDAKLRTPEAGGPYEIVVYNPISRSILKNVLIGEVWLCSGQSNMEWNSTNKLKEMIDELPNTLNSNIRLLHVSNSTSLGAQNNIFDSWTECNPETVKQFSAIGYFIAKKLNKELNVPIGIINSSWGGTFAELWTPANVIVNDPELLLGLDNYKKSSSKPHEPGSLWNSMISPFVGYNIAGVYWYQGESNINSWNNYGKLLTGLINGWRSAWEYEFPFYYVQIGPYDYKSKPEEQKGALLREQQLKGLSIPKTGMVVITDLVSNVKNIHPAKKREVASRLSDLALVEIYNREKKDYKSPVYKNHKIEGSNIIVEFDYSEGELKVEGARITDLFIADDSQKFIQADFKISNNKLIVFNKSVKNPVAVRFGFNDISMPNLFNSKGLPVSPFRTDDWKL